MTAAPDLDPYLLPTPGPATPVISDHLLASEHAHLNARFADPVWPLAPLTANPSTSKFAINWGNCPDLFQTEVRTIAWTMINGQLRPTYLKERSRRMRSRLSISATASSLRHWMNLARWLHKRGITTLVACDQAIWKEYSEHLGSRHSRTSTREILVALTRLWAFDQLSVSPVGLARTPWDEFGIDDYLPAATTSAGGENTREALATETMGPLLIWAMRTVDDLAADILAAWAERQRLIQAARTNPSTPQSRAALEAYLRPLIATDKPLPRHHPRGEPAPRSFLHWRCHRRICA